MPKASAITFSNRELVKHQCNCGPSPSENMFLRVGVFVLVLDMQNGDF